MPVAIRAARVVPIEVPRPAAQQAGSVGQALEGYLKELLDSDDPEQRQAALVVGTVYEGLLRSNLAKRPAQLLSR